MAGQLATLTGEFRDQLNAVLAIIVLDDETSMPAESLHRLRTSLSALPVSSKVEIVHRRDLADHTFDLEDPLGRFHSRPEQLTIIG